MENKNNMVPCKCGCGLLRPEFDKRGCRREYIGIHASRVRHHSEETRQKMFKHAGIENKIVSCSKPGCSNVFPEHPIKPSGVVCWTVIQKYCCREHNVRYGDRNPIFGDEILVIRHLITKVVDLLTIMDMCKSQYLIIHEPYVDTCLSTS